MQLWTRRSVVRLVVSALIAVAAGCSEARLSPGGVTASPGEAAPVRVRVMTYNILHGAGLDNKVNLARTAEVIKRVHPDLVALQEVDKGTERSGRVDEAAELGRLTGMHAVFGKAMDFNGGQYGEAILSRYPLESTTSYALPQLKGREPRESLEVRVRIAGPGSELVRFMSTHWDHLDDDSNRIPQAKFTADLAAKEPATPFIMCGDLNDQPGSRAIEALGPGWVDTTKLDPRPSWRSDAPTVRLDYIFARPVNRWRVVSAEVVNEPLASDHRPVLAVLEFLPAK